MWLETLKAGTHKQDDHYPGAREHAAFSAVPPRPSCASPPAREMMNFTDAASTRVALFPANAGKNIHMLRLPGDRSVFIGHGDSDKARQLQPVQPRSTTRSGSPARPGASGTCAGRRRRPRRATSSRSAARSSPPSDVYGPPPPTRCSRCCTPPPGRAGPDDPFHTSRRDDGTEASSAPCSTTRRASGCCTSRTRDRHPGHPATTAHQEIVAMIEEATPPARRAARATGRRAGPGELARLEVAEQAAGGSARR